MLLKSLEIQGFKTFPEKTVLTFHDGITAVVGPNGSGKSNISDAMRWVLGEQSIRTLRCTRMEDVIFNGTPGRKPMGYAEVTLNIDNQDRRLPFDKDEVSVTRRYYRSGESEYRLNKVNVRLKDINELFMDTGLGRDGYSIIGQGKIDAIVAAKGEDRREVFEEAVGISRFRYRKEESERKLSAAEENLLRLNDILSELESRVGPLKEQSQKAQEFLDYSEEKRTLEIGLWLHTLGKSGRILKEQEDKIALAQSQREAAAKALDDLQEKIEQNFSESSKATTKADEIRQQISSLEAEAVQKDGEADVCLGDVRHAEEMMKRLQTELETSQNDQSRLEEEMTSYQAEILQKQQQIEALNQTMVQVNEKLDSLRRTMNEASAQIDDFSRQMTALSQQVTEAKVRETASVSSISEIGMRLSVVEETLKTKSQKREELELSFEESGKMLQEMDTKISALQNTVRGYELRLLARRKKADEQKREAEQQLLEAKETDHRIKVLEDLERNLEGFAKSVKIVMQEAKHGVLSGIHGPVSRILSVPGEYAVALETALGGAMQYVVVESEQDAKTAIRLLKKKDSGRATFLPLTSVHGKSLQERGLSQCGGFVGIASDLCSCEPKYDSVRDSLLGRIVVAQNLDDAVEIARKFSYHFRIVTLDGQVVNSGGSLTGGSLARNSGLLRRASEIEELHKKAMEQHQKAKESEEKYHHLSEETSAAQASLQATQGELLTAQEDRIQLKSNRGRLQSDLDGMVSDCTQLHEEKVSAADRLKEQEENRRAAKAEEENITQKIAEISEKLEEKSGNRTDFNQQSDDLSEKCQTIKMEILGEEKDADSLRRKVEELQQQKINHIDHAKALEEEIGTLKEQHEQAKEKSDALKKEAESLRETAKAQTKQIDFLNEHRMKLEQESTQLRRQEREKSEEKELSGHDLARLEERRDNLQKEYDSIISKLWEEYEMTPREAKESAPEIENPPEAQKRLNTLKGKIRALGNVNVSAIEEYKEVNERYEFMNAQVQDIEKSRDELHHLIGELTHQMKGQFQEGFQKIGAYFSSIFRELFGGGTASLSLSDPENPLTSGIEIQVQPPGKIVAHIEALSGGEKSLVAIALYFSIMKVNPPPFCILDEIEAALDDVNVDRFAAYLRRMNAQTQFIVITHRRGSMEEADMLYGVTMQEEGISKVLKLHTNEIEKELNVS